MQKLSDRLQTDPKVWFGPLFGDQIFSNFANSEVPALLQELAHDKLTFELLLEIQYHLAKRWANLAPSEQNRNIARSLEDWSKPAEFLRDVWFCNQKEYCIEKGFLSGHQFTLMAEGWLSVYYLLQNNPAAFFAPLLLRNKLQI